MTLGGYAYGSSALAGLVPPPGGINIIITDISVGITHCMNECNVICQSNDCSFPIIMNITVTWQNIGNIVGMFVPTLNITPPGSSIPTTYTLSQVTLAAGDIVNTIFSDINLGAGRNNICASTG